MALNFKAKTGVLDVMLSAFYANFLFPLNVVWVGLFLLLLHATDITRFLRAGQTLWFAAASGLVFLNTLFWVVLVNVSIVGLNTLFGKFRTAYLEQDITLDAESLTSVTAEGETKTALKNVMKYAETGRRVFFYLSGGQANAFPKAGLTPEQLLEIKGAFPGRVSRVIPFVSRAMVPFTAAVILAVLLGLLKPEYTVQTASGNLQAFWQEDRVVVSVPVVLTGRRTSLLEEVFPLFALLVRKDPGALIAAPVMENHVFIVRDGRLKAVTLLGGGGETLGQIQPVGDDLLLVRYVKRRQEFSRFDGENFIPVEPQAREEILKRMRECRRDRCGWKAFTLWDEDEDEEEDPEADQQYRATLRLKSSELILGLDQTWVNRKEYVQDRLFTLKGLDASGAVEELLAVKGKPRKVPGAEYRRLFPKTLTDSVKETGVEEEADVPLEDAAPPTLGATPEPTAHPPATPTPPSGSPSPVPSTGSTAPASVEAAVDPVATAETVEPGPATDDAREPSAEPATGSMIPQVEEGVAVTAPDAAGEAVP